jgi:uncharacterized protein (DUF58 family)
MRFTSLRALAPFLLFAALALRGFGAVNVQSTLSPEQVNIGDEVSVTYTISNGQVEDFQLPPVDGVTVEGSSTSARIVMNGLSVSQNFSHTFLLVANRAGNVIIPALKDASNGSIIKTHAMVLHVLGVASGPPAQVPVTAPPADQSPGANGPVVMPPADANDADNGQAGTPDNGSGTVLVPTDPDGQPARVFDVITPQTTTAYVGEAVPLRIESYIRADANAQQDSLPDLTGSDFLMNNLSLRPAEEGVNAGNIEYIRDSWLTAISAPRSGDFPLQATRDTYWTRSTAPTMPDDPFGPLFGRPSQLLHKDILSNKLVMHILPLPEEGKPASFTGAIGKFQVSGNATPDSVSVGDPVTIRFTVTGTGNFDYVRAPALAADPAWKSYVATSKITYQEESHTQAMKIFEQAVIPQKGGTLKLPDATFSYFDPDAKRYVTVPVSLPVINVTGSAAPPPAVADAGSAGASVPGAVPAAPAPAGFAPNRLSFGSLTPDLTPAYRREWFWAVQGALGLAIIAGLVLSAVGPRRDPARGERALRHASLRREEEAMTQAAQAGDAVTFFTAARHAVQLRLAERWHVPAESLTLAAISSRDPALGETLAPLFAQADDVIYSGRAPAGLDLHEWNRRTREMLQPART